jgi:rod shape-determining protein MreC
MNRGLLSFLFVLTTLVVGTIYYTNTLQPSITNILNNIKGTYHKSVEFVQNGFYKHFHQSTHINELQEELKQYKNDHLIMQQLAYELDTLLESSKSSLTLKPDVELVRVISYESFDNFNRLWIDMQDYNSSKIYGLVYKELVAGIVINKNNYPLALLNSDEQSTYAVHVGPHKASGIAKGTNSQNIIVKYLPAWIEIKVGDEVVTSGLDNLFFTGLKVGKVISVSKAHGYQSAVVQPYYIANFPNYFHIIRSVR